MGPAPSSLPGRSQRPEQRCTAAPPPGQPVLGGRRPPHEAGGVSSDSEIAEADRPFDGASKIEKQLSLIAARTLPGEPGHPSQKAEVPNGERDGSDAVQE